MKLNPWNLRLGQWELDPYPLIRPILFRIDPEVAHERTIRMLQRGWGPQETGADDPILHTSVFGLDFPNPIGVAAGLDKQAEAIDAVMALGFGFGELGGVTPRPQPGNPRPRMFRAPEAKAVINRFGFNSVGADVFAARMRAWRESAGRCRFPIGVNLAKNKDTVDDAADFVIGLEKLAPYVDFVTVNVSSPNTPGLRDLQGRERLNQVMAQVMATRHKVAPALTVFIKIAPDLTPEQQQDIAAVARDNAVQGIIVSNTTIARPDILPPDLAQQAGGLSGKPLFEPSTRVLAAMRKLTEGKIPLIGCGGVSSGADAYAKIRAGASLVQIYTALVYEGPLVVRRIKRDLATLLRRDGFKSVAEAVGTEGEKG